MNHRPRGDAVRERMQELRCEIDEDVEDVSASAHAMVDWKHYVKAHPWVSFGAAVALGFLIVPKRSRAIRPDAATPTEPVGTGHVVAKPAPTFTAGLIAALLAAVTEIAIRKATTCLSQSARRLLGVSDQPETSHHDSNCTP
jgi:hypothetical protein